MVEDLLIDDRRCHRCGYDRGHRRGRRGRRSSFDGCHPSLRICCGRSHTVRGTGRGCCRSHQRRGSGCLWSDFGCLAHEPVDDVGRHTQVVQVDDLSRTQGEGFPDVTDVFGDHPFIQSTAGQLHHVGHRARQGRCCRNSHGGQRIDRGRRLSGCSRRDRRGRRGGRLNRSRSRSWGCSVAQGRWNRRRLNDHGPHRRRWWRGVNHGLGSGVASGGDSQAGQNQPQGGAGWTLERCIHCVQG